MKECRKKKQNCFLNALSRLKRLSIHLDLMAIQEVSRESIKFHIERSRPELDGASRGCVWKRSSTGPPGTVIHIVLLWNRKRLGDVVFSSTIDLDYATSRDRENVGGRPCHVVVLQRKHGDDVRNLIVYAAHFPHFKTRKQLQRIEALMTAQLPSSIKIHDVVCLADANDEFGMISASTPLHIGRYNLSHNLTKTEARKKLKSCCWIGDDRTRNHTWTSDYVLGRRVRSTYIPKEFLEDRDRKLTSDHLPVAAEMTIR